MNDDDLEERALNILEHHHDDIYLKSIEEPDYAKDYIMVLQGITRELLHELDVLKEKTRWKPIADMPEELDGRILLVKTSVKSTKILHKQPKGWCDTAGYVSDIPTHFMEIPNE